jgi:hypothetical protein
MGRLKSAYPGDALLLAMTLLLLTNSKRTRHLFVDLRQHFLFD